MSSLSIIMPCYNHAYELPRVLSAYDAQSGSEPFELIAVDDGSSDRTYQVLSQYQPRRFVLKTAQMEKNSGPAAARNRGLEMAKSPLVMFVGDDVLPERDLVMGHLAAHNRFAGQTEAILGRLVWPEDLPVNTLMAHIDGKGAEQFSYYYLQHDHLYDYRHFYTSNISLKRDLLLQEGQFFDTGFIHAAFEDAELSYRLSRRGMTIRYQRHLLAYHYHYHTIWTFSTRQYKAGLMGLRMVQKHPELAKQIQGARFPLRVALLLLEHWLKPNRMAVAGRTEELEQLALHSASWFEWRANPFLEPYYLGLLNYFYNKGMQEGFLSGQPALRKIVLSEYAARLLLPLLKDFWRQSLASGGKSEIGPPSGNYPIFENFRRPMPAVTFFTPLSSIF